MVAVGMIGVHVLDSLLICTYYLTVANDRRTQGQAMARFNAYIPDSLREAMDELEDINWSAVAQTAFLKRLEIERLKKTNMEAAKIERLRKSKEDAVESWNAVGNEAGKRWALEVAEYDDVVRVVSDSSEGWHMRNLVELTSGDEQASWDEVVEFWENWVGGILPDDEDVTNAFIEGFREGVREVYDEI